MRGLVRALSVGGLALGAILSATPSAVRAEGEPAPAAAPLQPAISNAPIAAPAAVPVATPAPAAAAPVAEAAPPAAPAPAASPAAPAAQEATSVRKGPQGSDGGRATTTRYSHRRSGGMSSRSAESPKSDEPEQADIVCRAGCKQAPGEIVQAAPEVQPQGLAQPVPGAEAKAESLISCVAGCFGAPQQFSGVVSEVQSAQPAPRGKVATSAPTSGEWLVKINRERPTATK